MTSLTRVLTLGLALLFVTAGLALAGGDKGKTYRVTITNLTKKQVLTPPVVISHNSDFRLFTIGQSAGDGLVAVAEGGDTLPLEAMLGTHDGVFDYRVGDGVILPGQSQTIMIDAKGKSAFLSLVGMLASTNDAFVAINGTRFPQERQKSLTAVAYDAGSEANTELCSDLPGPPCAADSGNARVTTGAEGFVHLHNGIHGVGDLSAANMDWHNPVATVVIEKMRD